MKLFNNKLIRILFPLIHTIILLFVCYAIWNSPYTFSSESGFIRKFNVVKRLFTGNGVLSDNILPVNVAYDRELVPFYDEMGIPAGQIDITDRAKLLEFFRYIAEENSHRYIVCDIFFDSSLRTSFDDSLFNLLARIPRLVVPLHENAIELPPLLVPKSAYADYKVNIIEGNLLKYQYLQNGQKSIPLFMWQELTGGSFEEHFFTYRMNGKIATNSVILDFKTELQGAYNEEGEKNYFNLGSDMLKILGEIKPKDFFRDKIILIGDLSEHDIHDTTVGTIPGIFINYNAYQMLEDGRPVMPLLLWILLFVGFLIASFLIFSDSGLLQYIPPRGILNSDVVQFAITWVGFSFMLSVVNLLIYFVWGRFIEIFILSSYFTLLKTVFNFYNLLKRKNNEKNNNDSSIGSCIPLPSCTEHNEDNLS